MLLRTFPRYRRLAVYKCLRVASRNLLLFTLSFFRLHVPHYSARNDRSHERYIRRSPFLPRRILSLFFFFSSASLSVSPRFVVDGQCMFCAVVAQRYHQHEFTSNRPRVVRHSASQVRRGKTILHNGTSKNEGAPAPLRISDA